MESKLVSLVVPVFKTEKYLDRCIRSIVGQSYQNLELILVDDGSPDKSGEICERWSKRDSRIRVIHKENGGLSDARNIGTASAQGDYVTYVDSDDYVSVDYIQYLTDLMEENNADISCCGMVTTYQDTAEFQVDQNLPSVTVMTGYEACEGLLKSYYMKMVTACGKLYKRDILLKHPFPKEKIFEDEATTGKFYYEARRVVLGSSCLYGYYQNPESITHTGQQSKTEEKIWALTERESFFREQNERELAKLSHEKLIGFFISESLDEPGKYDKYWLPDFRFRQASPKMLCKVLLYKTLPALYRKMKDYQDAKSF